MSSIWTTFSCSPNCLDQKRRSCQNLIDNLEEILYYTYLTTIFGTSKIIGMGLTFMTRTLMIIKPDAVSRNLVGEIIRRVESEGFQVVEMKMIKLSRSQAGEFYAVHKERPFYRALLDFMISDSVVPVVLERDDAVSYLRQVIGNTDSAKAEPGTIRKDMAISVQKNAVHASDSPENAQKEIAFFFGSEALAG